MIGELLTLWRLICDWEGELQCPVLLLVMCHKEEDNCSEGDTATAINNTPMICSQELISKSPWKGLIKMLDWSWNTAESKKIKTILLCLSFVDANQWCLAKFIVNVYTNTRYNLLLCTNCNYQFRARSNTNQNQIGRRLGQVLGCILCSRYFVDFNVWIGYLYTIRKHK